MNSLLERELKGKFVMLIETEMSLLMNYFIDERPVSARILQRKCASGVIEKALGKGFIRECGKDEDGYSLYVVTESGKRKRNN